MVDIDTETNGGEIAALYLDHRQPLLDYLTRLLQGERHTAEDVCQESFAKVVRHWAQRDPQKDSVRWLYRIATHTAYDELRRRRHRRSTPLQNARDVAHPDMSFDTRVSEAVTVAAALARLSPWEREPLVLQAYEDRKLSEIAEGLQCSLAAVKSRLRRARAHFREVYQP